MNNKTSEYVWRGRRYWVQDPKSGQHQGWNTWFEAYRIVKTTAKRIITISDDGLTVHLDKEILNGVGKIYHSKFGEYFYKEKPLIDPEKRYLTQPAPQRIAALKILGLEYPCRLGEVKAAYKRLARERHPDFGGSHEAFIELNIAYEDALRIVG